ncbi:hypothetical protein ACFVAJ_17835 [Agromyces sp. NPDC057679]|uniref:hypothetical protein n=1 Tax=Agromyces sp. NPDC057679 TaxID=3346207 RepID=UPI0036704A55
MSAYPIWVIMCSVDGEPVDFDAHADTLRKARSNARALGWQTGSGTRGPDFCPKHIPAPETSKES